MRIEELGNSARIRMKASNRKTGQIETKIHYHRVDGHFWEERAKGGLLFRRSLVKRHFVWSDGGLCNSKSTVKKRRL